MLFETINLINMYLKCNEKHHLFWFLEYSYNIMIKTVASNCEFFFWKNITNIICASFWGHTKQRTASTSSNIPLIFSNCLIWCISLPLNIWKPLYIILELLKSNIVTKIPNIDTFDKFLIKMQSISQKT